MNERIYMHTQCILLGWGLRKCLDEKFADDFVPTHMKNEFTFIFLGD